ncbi:NADPH:quinone reductase [Primorskyibacter sp. S87]|uniref:NADPH:quinone reductase n=1 Tax=Primorskyibacter sp. S87 TaxID=3415126 RepID=UPI003C7B32E9
MKAISYSAFGAASDVLNYGDIENPIPSPGEVTVDLAYSAVNPSDVKARSGSRPGVTKPPFPVIVPHSDGSGRVSAVGSGVNPARIGEEVWVWNGQWRRPFGTAAQQIALPSEQAVPLPRKASLETGATLGIPGTTAAHMVFSGGSVSDASVLVHGGAGSVGFLAVQLAKWGGARVIATASPGKSEKVLEAGADVVLDYADPDLAAQIISANGGHPVDRIVELEFGENVETDIEVIAENGRINAYGSAHCPSPVLPFMPLMFKSVTLEMGLVYLLPRDVRDMAIGKLDHAIADGALYSPVDRVLPLKATDEAHDLVASGRRNGAVLLEIP